MNIEVNGRKYDIRYRQEFVPSPKTAKPVRRTTATLSSIDPTKVGAEKYTVVNSATLTQSVKDRDNKVRAKKMATSRVLCGAFDKVDRAMIWEQILPVLEPDLVD